ncbi:sialidase-2-like [Rhinoraja longicauda]
MASSAPVHTIDLFEKDHAGRYHIPALLHFPNSNILLAFAERRGSLRDEDTTVLCMREGMYDNSSDTFWWEDIKTIQSAQKMGCRSTNPCLVYEKDMDIVFLFFIAVDRLKTEQDQIISRKNAARLCYVTSDDQGQNWSATNDVTESVIGDTINKWATFALGPGHGIQLNNGRLIIPASAHEIESNNQVRERAFTFFSDNHGESWQFGSFVFGEECGECQVALVYQFKVSSCICCKVGNSKQALIYCNARSNKGGVKQCRVEVFSRDGGRTFTEGKLVKQLVEPPGGCHGSVISFPSSAISHVKNYPKLEKHYTQKKGDSSEFDVILFSHTTNSKSRKDLGIYLTTCSGRPHTWTNPWVISAGECGYSELVFINLPKERHPIVACLFERGSLNENISFCVLQIFDIIENTVKKMH